MPSTLSKRIGEINAELTALLSAAQSAVSEQTVFTADQVLALSRPVSEMAPILAAAKLHPQIPEIEAQLATYKQLLRQLQPTLDQLRDMLLLKRAQLYSGQTQVQAVSRWATALNATHEP